MIFLFWNGRRIAGRLALKFRSAYGTYYAQLLVETINLTWSGQAMNLWRHKRGNLRPTFHRKRDFSRFACYHWLEWRHYAVLGQMRTKSDFWHYIFAFWRPSEVTDLDWPIPVYIGAKLTFLWGGERWSWSLEKEYTVHFFVQTSLNGLLTSSDVSQVYWTSRHRAFFMVRVAFHTGVLCITIIRSICRNRKGRSQLHISSVYKNGHCRTNWLFAKR